MPRIFIFIFIFIFTFFSACENDPAEVRELASPKDALAEKGEDVRVLYSDSGKLKIKLAASKLLHYTTEKPYTELPEGFKLIFFNDSLKKESTLTADYGISYDEEQKMTAKGNVIAINKNGDKLFTEELVWDEKKGLIYSNEFVKIITPDEIIYGEGFEANQDFTNYKIKKIKGTISVETDEEQQGS